MDYLLTKTDSPAIDVSSVAVTHTKHVVRVSILKIKITTAEDHQGNHHQKW
jgi:hypothetical protein